jgi:hypothetical protein
VVGDFETEQDKILFVVPYGSNDPSVILDDDDLMDADGYSPAFKTSTAALNESLNLRAIPGFVFAFADKKPPEGPVNKLTIGVPREFYDSADEISVVIMPTGSEVNDLVEFKGFIAENHKSWITGWSETQGSSTVTLTVSLFHSQVMAQVSRGLQLANLMFLLFFTEKLSGI